MDNRALKIVVALGGLLGTALILYVALTRPGYFTNNTNIAGILLLELLAVAVWLYRRIFFAIVMTVFLLAGVDLPVGGIWTMARWGVLALGALVGLIIVFKERRFSFGIFEILAFLALLAAVMSAAVSRFTSFSFLKVLSLLLLFLYSATGARVAVLGRESNRSQQRQKPNVHSRSSLPHRAGCAGVCPSDTAVWVLLSRTPAPHL